MKRKLPILAAVIVLAAVAWLLIANHDSTPMPVYQGKTAREWMFDVWKTNQPLAFDAFREMGSNAVPFLMHEFQRTNAWPARAYSWIYGMVPQLIRQSLPRPLSDTARWFRVESFVAVMPRQAVLPGLNRFIREGCPMQQMIAMDLLQGNNSPEDTNCVPSLIECLKSPDGRVRSAARITLDEINLGKEATPLLTNSLSSTNIVVRMVIRDLLLKIDPTNAIKYEVILQNKEAATGAQLGSPQR
jgi:hypothetical protein